MGALTDATLPDGTKIHYITDPLNRRIAKEVNGTVTEKYLWEDLTTLLAVYDKDDNLVWRFEYADGRMPVSMTDKNGNRYYLHYDQVGSLRAVSDTNGNVVKEIIYDTYGNIINDTNRSLTVLFGFAGGLYDSDTKLTHFGYREYDAYTGKWTSKDPIGFAGGDSNLYGYVLGDPVNLVDPFGLKPPAHIPPKVDMCKNEKIAREISPLEFYKRVKNFGAWDYKRLNPALYENFGNYHFGYVAAAFGIPKNIAKAGAGAYQIYSNHSKIEWYNSYFDDPKDQKWIDEGYKDYSSNYYNCRCVE